MKGETDITENYQLSFDALVRILPKQLIVYWSSTNVEYDAEGLLIPQASVNVKEGYDAKKLVPLTITITADNYGIRSDVAQILPNGDIVDIGTHSELLERCSVYQEIHYSQNKKETK